MKLGLGLPHAGQSATPTEIARAATGAEEIGLDSVWVLDRLLRPLQPGWGDAPSAYYKTVFDPIETLSFVAARTQRVHLGTSAIQALLQPPVILARRLATLDQLSAGRLIAGIGRGWMPEEFAVAGVPMSRRAQRFGEFISAMRAVWGPDPVAFEGEHYTIPESDIGPKPVQPGGVPIFVGYNSDIGIRLAAGCADGLNPNRSDLATLRRDLDVFHATAEKAGRDPAALPIVFRGAARLENGPNDDRPLFVGTIDDMARDLEQLKGLGIEHVFLQFHTPVDEQLSTMAQLRERVR